LPRIRRITLEEVERMTQEEIDDFVRNLDSTKPMCPYEEEDCDPWTTGPVKQVSEFKMFKDYLRGLLPRRRGKADNKGGQ